MVKNMTSAPRQVINETLNVFFLQMFFFTFIPRQEKAANKNLKTDGKKRLV